MSRAVRLKTGVDKVIDGLQVHISGQPYSNYKNRSVRFEIDSHTDLELHESTYNGERTWIIYEFYTQTQCKTHGSKYKPSKYEKITEKIEKIMNQSFEPFEDN